MTEADRIECEGLARAFRHATGRPMIVTPSLMADLQKAGMDTANIVAAQAMPRPKLVYAAA